MKELLNNYNKIEMSSINCSPEVSQVYLNADDIADIIYSQEINEIQQEHLNNFDINSIELKTRFELLLMITTAGLKLFYGNSEGKVDITLLDEEKIQFLNSKLKYLGIYLNVEIISILHWNFGQQVESYDKIKITRSTKLEELKAIFNRGNYFVISFSKIN